jgi:hypothetical protein
MDWIQICDGNWTADEAGYQAEVRVITMRSPRPIVLAAFELNHGATGIVNASGWVFVPHDNIRPVCSVCDGSKRVRGKRCPACLGDGRDVAREGRELCEVLLAGMHARVPRTPGE